jgi:hypothetical protein
MGRPVAGLLYIGSADWDDIDVALSSALLVSIQSLNQLKSPMFVSNEGCDNTILVRMIHVSSSGKLAVKRASTPTRRALAIGGKAVFIHCAVTFGPYPEVPSHFGGNRY